MSAHADPSLPSADEHVPPAPRAAADGAPSLAWLVQLSLLGAGLVAMLVAVAVLGLQLRQSLDAGEARRLRVTAELSATQISDFIETHRGAVGALAAAAPRDADWERLLVGVRAQYPRFITMMAIDPAGTIVAGAPQARPDGTRYTWAGNSVADRAYFRAAVAGRRSYVSDSFRGRGFGTAPLVAVSAPVLDDDGRVATVVQGSIDSDAFSLYRARVLEANHIEMVLLDRAMHVIYASPTLRWKALEAVRLPPDVHGDDAPALVLDGFYADGEGAMTSRAVTEHGWTVVIAQRASRHEARLFDDLLRMLVPGALSLLVMAWAAWLLSRRIVRPLVRLSRQMQEFSLQSHPARYDAPDTFRELRALGDAFNLLGQRLRASYLRVSEALDEQHRLRGELEREIGERERIVETRTADLRRSNARLQTASQTDALTGALNYRGFEAAYARAWAQARREERTLAVVACDIDFFKAYNDHYGHPAGDACLRAVVAALRGALREDDVLARVGGEEFTVLALGRDHAHAAALAERLRHAVRDAGIAHRARPDGGTLVTLSLGVATDADGAGTNTPGDLLAAADAALYRAKRAGRDRVAD